MSARDEIIEALQAIRPLIEGRYPLRLIGLVGSAARGELREDSDIDVLAEGLPGLSLFTLGDAEAMLEDALGRKVDLLLAGGIKPRVMERMRRDLRLL